MSEMIERVARALYECEAQTTDHFARDCFDPSSAPVYNEVAAAWDDITEADRDPFRKKVRAVLNAMREPTEAQASAGMHLLSEMPVDAGWPTLARTACSMWQAMIDAALAPPPGDGER